MAKLRGEGSRGEEILFDWNTVEKVGPISRVPIQFLDETLCDGIRSPSVVDPSLDDKIRLLHLMDDLGIDVADLGHPGAKERQFDDVVRLAREAVDSKLAIRPACAARVFFPDTQPILEVSQKVGVEIEVLTLIPASPIRSYVSDKDIEDLLRLSSETIDLAVRNGLPCTVVLEDMTRARPETLDPLIRHAIGHGARRICVADSTGHATPDGLRRLINFIRNVVRGAGAEISLDWHGHNDRGLAVTNSLYAIEAGCDRIHGTACGIGVRAGNAALDQILLNLKLLGEIDNDLGKLLAYCHVASSATRFPIPPNYPLAGRDAFRTASGEHAEAIRKALHKGDEWLADRIYSGVPAGAFGREQEIDIGLMSDEANVVFWLEKRGFEVEPMVVNGLLALAKQGDRVLEESEVYAAIDDIRRKQGKPMN